MNPPALRGSTAALLLAVLIALGTAAAPVAAHDLPVD